MGFEKSNIEDVISAIRAGELVVVTDDEHRENEGDLITAASLITPEKINFMVKFARGLVCVPLPEERASALHLTTPAILSDPFKTAFTESVASLTSGEGLVDVLEDD